MKKEIFTRKDSDTATRGDVKEIVTEVVSTAFTHFTLHVLPPIIESVVVPVVERIVDEKINEFAGIVKRSFEHIEDQMVTKDEFYPFKESTERSFYYLQTDVDDLKTRMGRVENRLDKVESKIDSLEVKMDVMVDMYNDHDVRIVNLEQKTLAMA